MEEGTKFTAVIRSAEEITGYKGIVSFKMKDGASFSHHDNELAGETITVKAKTSRNCYDYTSGFSVFKKEWLKDITPIVEDQPAVINGVNISVESIKSMLKKAGK